MPALIFSRPKPILIIDCKCEKRRPSLLAPDSALRQLITSRATCWSNSSSGRQVGPLPSSGPEEPAAATAAAAFGDAGMTLFRKFCFHLLLRFLAPRRLRFCEEAAYCHGHPPWMAAC